MILKNISGIGSLLFGLTALLSTLSAAQTPPEERKTARVLRIDIAVQVDGMLEEPVWREAPVITKFLQKDPHEGESATEDLTMETLFQSGDRLFFRYGHLFDRIRKSFDIQGVSVLTGAYTWDSAQFRFTPSPNRKLSGDIGFRKQWGFYGGENTEISWSPLWKPSANLSLGPVYQLNWVTLPQGKFTSHLINSQLNYSFNNRWPTATTVQYNSVAHLAAINFRLNYIYRPGDDFFLIYNESRTVATGGVEGPWNRSIIAKITHSWDF